MNFVKVIPSWSFPIFSIIMSFVKSGFSKSIENISFSKFWESSFPIFSAKNIFGKVLNFNFFILLNYKLLYKIIPKFWEKSRIPSSLN